MPAFMSRRFTGTSRGADTVCLYCLNTQHDPWWASSFAWRTGGDDDGLLGAQQLPDRFLSRLVRPRVWVKTGILERGQSHVLDDLWNVGRTIEEIAELPRDQLGIC